MILARKKLEVDIPQDKLNEVRQVISQEYPALYDSLNELSWKKLGLQAGTNIGNIEIYPFYGNNLLYYRNLNPGLEVGGIILEKAHEENFNKFCQKLREKLSGIEANLPEWQDVKPVKDTFQEIKENSNYGMPTPEEFSAARHLLSEKTREFLREIKKNQRKMLSENAPELEMANELGNCGLLEREYQIFCRDNGLQLMRVDSEAFSDMVKNQFRCTTCGRPFDKERLDLWVSLSKLGNRLVKKHYWLALLIMQQMLEMGIDAEKMVLAGDTQGYTLFINQDHHLLLLEIKETSPTAEEIYFFSEKQRFFKADFAIYFSLLPVSSSARRYLLDSANCDIEIVELQENLNQVMNQALTQKRADYIREVFAELGKDYLLPISELAYRSIFEATPKPVTGEKTENLTLPAVEIKEEEAKISTIPLPEQENIQTQPELVTSAPQATEPPGAQSSHKEAEEAVIGQLWDNILFKGVGNWPELEKMLVNHFSATNTSAALLDNLGLVIVKHIADKQLPEEAETLAPFGVEAANKLEALFEAGNYARPDAVSLEGETGTLRVRKVDQNYLVMWDRKNYPENQPESATQSNLAELAKVSQTAKLVLMNKNGEIQQTYPENLNEQIFKSIWEIGEYAWANMGFGNLKKIVILAQNAFFLELHLKEDRIIALFSQTPLEAEQQAEFEKSALNIS